MKREHLKEFFRRQYRVLVEQDEEDPFATDDEGDDEGGDEEGEEGGDEGGDEEGDDEEEVEVDEEDEDSYLSDDFEGEGYNSSDSLILEDDSI